MPAPLLSAVLHAGGSSGAGKTTLLDVLANRKTKGTVRGDVRANDAPVDYAFLAQFMGYVEQHDLHFTRSTVREAVLFAARTRLPPDVSRGDAVYFAEHIIDVMALTPEQHRLVGSDTERVGAISADARKRLSVAVEYAANGSLYFLDEPTSGLDARSALRVMRAVRAMADNNTAVLVVIHQPSYAVFCHFDELLLLARGGRVVYFGELGARAHQMSDYFARQGAPPIARGANPADYMLRVIGAGVSTTTTTTAAAAAEAEEEEGEEEKECRDAPSADGADGDGAAAQQRHNNAMEKDGGAVAAADVDWAEVWAASPEAATASAKLHALMRESAAYPPLQRRARTAREELARTALVVRRQLTTYWRTPNYNLSRLMMALALGLIIGLFFLRLPRNQSALNAYVSVLYLSLLYAVFQIQNVMGPMFNERPAFYREVASRTYKPSAYGVALTIAEIPYSIAGALIFTLLLYFMVGYAATDYGYFLLMNCLFSLFAVSLGQALSALLSSKVVAVMISGFLIPTMNIFAGFLAPRPSIPGWLIWVYYANPYRYALEGLVVSALSGVTFRCEPGEFVQFPLPPGWSECTHGGEVPYMNVREPSVCAQGGVPTASAAGAVACCQFCPVTRGAQLIQQFGMRPSWKWIDIGAVAAFYLLFQVLVYVALTRVRHLTR